MAVYLIHFERAYRHARHYIGYAGDVAARCRAHGAGNGARLLAVIAAAGIGYRVVRVWADGDRSFERALKNRKNSARLCPCCNPGLRDRTGCCDGD